MRLGILTTHPIQYYAPWFQCLSDRYDLTVLYAHRQDAGGQARAGFGVEFEWDVPLLDGYQYHWLNNVSKTPSLSTFSGCDTPEVSNLITRHGFDAFLVTGWNKKCYWQALRACKRRAIPVLCRGDSQLFTPRSRLKMTAKYLPYRLLLPRFDIHLYVGRRNREYLKHYGVADSQLEFCPHFIDNDFFSAKADEARQTGQSARIRRAFGIPENAFVLLYVGKFISKKRVPDAVDASLQLIAEGHPVHLLLVGDGPMRSELERRAEPKRPRIHFAGFRNQQELPAFYAAASAVVLPSGDETWGLVINEAMACRLPAIVSDAVGCAPDLVDPDETGLTYPVGDINGLSRQIERMAQLCSNAASRVHEAVQAKSASYSLEAASEGLGRALQRVMPVRDTQGRLPRIASVDESALLG